MSKKLATVIIDIDDVRKAGGVVAAIEKRANESSELAAGVVGMAFATSGPGPGWTKQYGPDEWSREAFSGGALAYIDAEDGRVRRAEPAEEWTPADQLHHDLGGGAYTVGDWSGESEVCVECPAEEDALEYPELVAEMARSVVKYHYDLSPVKDWKQLVEKIKAAAEALDDIDPDQFDD